MIFNKIILLIKEEINNFVSSEKLNEIFNEVIRTEYEIISKYIKGFNVFTFRFKTNSGETYDLDFFKNRLLLSTQFDGDHNFYDILKNVDDEKYLKCSDIGFTVTSRYVNNGENINNADYNENTNKNETIELLGKLSFLIKEFIKLHSEYKIFVIGKDTDEIKLKIYKHIFQNIFSNEFIMFSGNSNDYDNGAFYFINREIIK
jgi:hypothetical protein